MAYVDNSAGSFSATHMQQCLRAYNYAQEHEILAHMMEKVHIYNVFTVFDLLSVLYSLQYHIAHQVSKSLG